MNTKHCSVENCARKYKARGFCDNHYSAEWKSGRLKIRKPLGMCETVTYKAWKSMKYRCYNPNFKQYRDYGGRGIKVCNRWKNSFVNFLADMGERPEGLSLDRINNDQGYSPDNCKWSTRVEQNNNQRMNKTNKSGIVGVSFHKISGSWQAYMRYNNAPKSLGYYKDFFEACCARKSAELRVS